MKKTYLRPFLLSPIKNKLLPQNGPEIKKPPKGGKLKLEDDVMKKTYLRPFFSHTKSNFYHKIDLNTENRLRARN